MTIEEAIRKANSLLRDAKSCGIDVLGADVKGNLNPGDVYDAFLAILRQPVVEDILEENRCGPFAAVFLYRCPDENPSSWRGYVERTFDSQYRSGFRDGFQLVVPDFQPGESAQYLRGVFEGVMANAAVF